MAEQGCLLSSCTGKTRAGGSNPPLSAPLFCVRCRALKLFQGTTKPVLRSVGNPCLPYALVTHPAFAGSW